MKKLDRFDFLTIGLALFHLAANGIWIGLNSAPLPWDQAGHTRLAMQFSQFFLNELFSNPFRYFTISDYYPPLIHSSVGLAIAIFGNPVATSTIIISMFFTALIIVLYVYSSDLFTNKAIGFLTAFIFSFFPVVYEHSRWFLLEIPTLTFVLLTLLMLHRSQKFRHSGYTYAFFLCAALAVLTKWLTLVYLAVPVVMAVVGYLKDERAKKDKRVIARGFAIFCAITAPWYIVNIVNILDTLAITVNAESSDPQNIWSVQNFVWYFYLFINFQVTLFFALLALASFANFILSKHVFRKLIMFTVGFIYLLFSFIPNKDWRYTMAILPFVAMIIAYLFVHLWHRKRLAGSILLSISTLYLVSYYFLLSFQFPVAIRYQQAVELPLVGWIDYVNINDNLAHAYNSASYPLEDMIKTVKSESKDIKVRVLTLVDQERISAGNLLLTRDMMGIRGVEFKSPPEDQFTSDAEMDFFLSTFHYVLIAKYTLGVEATRNIEVYEQLAKYIKREGSNAQLMQTFAFPNGEGVELYRLLKN